MLEYIFKFVIMNTLLFLGVYLSIAMLSFMLYVYSSRKLKDFNREKKFFDNPFNNNLSVIIYCHNNEKEIVELLERLNKQNYPKNNYQVNIILDNCTDNSSNILEFIGGAKIWRVGENSTFGKDEAISWVLERLVSFQNVNAYVFLDVNRIIDDNFLSSINTSLFDADVLIGSTELIDTKKNISDTIVSLYNKFHNRIVKCGRRFLGLSCQINSDIMVMKQEVLEAVKCIDFKDIDSELKYTTLLVKNGIIPMYAPNIKTFLDVTKSEYKNPSLKIRLHLFIHCLSLLFTTNIKFIEHVFFLLRPNVLLALAIYLLFVWFTYNYSSSFDLFFSFILVKVLGFATLFTFIMATLSLNFNLKSIFKVAMYPIYSLIKTGQKKPSLKNILKGLFTHKQTVQVTEKFIVDVIVTSGEKNFKCKLEIVSEDNLIKAIFWFKNKSYISSLYLRTCDAIKEITEKLESHGFRLKICQNCGYFSHKIDGSTNMIKGYCKSSSEYNLNKECYLWNSCENYIPKEINNVIDISTYKKD